MTKSNLFSQCDPVQSALIFDFWRKTCSEKGTNPFHKDLKSEVSNLQAQRFGPYVAKNNKIEQEDPEISAISGFPAAVDLRSS